MMLILLLLCLLSLVYGTATVPFIENWESYAAGTFTATEPWTLNSEGAYTIEATPNVAMRGSAILLTSTCNACLQNPTVTLAIDMSYCTSQNRVYLDFVWGDNVDEDHTLDRVEIGDGSTWALVEQIVPTFYTTAQYITNKDLYQLATDGGINLDSNFRIRFSQEDNYPATDDGMYFDEIYVYYAPFPNNPLNIFSQYYPVAPSPTGDWIAAEDLCQSTFSFGHLPDTYSLSALRHYADTCFIYTGQAECWIGLNARAGLPNWRFSSDGTNAVIYDSNVDTCNVDYCPWYTDEPSAGDDCVRLYTNLWRAVGCQGGTALGYMCQNKVRYHYETTAASYSAAEADCQGMGGDLASIWSSSQNYIMRKMSNDRSCWFGLNDKTAENLFVYNEVPSFTQYDDSTSTSYGYTNFALGQPDDSAGQDCVRLKTNGEWDDRDCSTNSYDYMCAIPVIVTPSPSNPPSTAPTETPTIAPTDVPTDAPTDAPTDVPTDVPTEAPTDAPTDVPTDVPTEAPTDVGVSEAPTEVPTVSPTVAPTVAPTVGPTVEPTIAPTVAPTVEPTDAPTVAPTVEPTVAPTVAPTVEPTVAPTVAPTVDPTVAPTEIPTYAPTDAPTEVGQTYSPTDSPTEAPTEAPTEGPTEVPTEVPTEAPTESTTPYPTQTPTIMQIPTPANASVPAPVPAPEVPVPGPYAPVPSTATPTGSPTQIPSETPTGVPTYPPTVSPTVSPSDAPTGSPSYSPTVSPTGSPTVSPTDTPTVSPTDSATEYPTEGPIIPVPAPVPVPGPQDEEEEEETKDDESEGESEGESEDGDSSSMPDASVNPSGTTEEAGPWICSSGGSELLQASFSVAKEVAAGTSAQDFAEMFTDLLNEDEDFQSTCVVSFHAGDNSWVFDCDGPSTLYIAFDDSDPQELDGANINGLCFSCPAGGDVRGDGGDGGGDNSIAIWLPIVLFFIIVFIIVMIWFWKKNKKKREYTLSAADAERELEMEPARGDTAGYSSQPHQTYV